MDLREPGLFGGAPGGSRAYMPGNIARRYEELGGARDYGKPHRPRAAACSATACRPSACCTSATGWRTTSPAPTATGSTRASSPPGSTRRSSASTMATTTRSSTTRGSPRRGVRCADAWRVALRRHPARPVWPCSARRQECHGATAQVAVVDAKSGGGQEAGSLSGIVTRALTPPACSVTVLKGAVEELGRRCASRGSAGVGLRCQRRGGVRAGAPGRAARRPDALVAGGDDGKTDISRECRTRRSSTRRPRR